MSKRRLLLADDSVTIQKVVNLTFADEGIEVIAVGNGDLAMERIAESRPDVVLADVNMPGLTGYEICERLRADDKTRSLPVILLVGSFEPFDEQESNRVGANGFLTKPFQSIRQLVTMVSELLEMSERSETGDTSDASESVDPGEVAAQDQPPTEDIEPLYNESFADTIEVPAAEIVTENFADAGMDDEMIETVYGEASVGSAAEESAILPTSPFEQRVSDDTPSFAGNSESSFAVSAHRPTAQERPEPQTAEFEFSDSDLLELPPTSAATQRFSGAGNSGKPIANISPELMDAIVRRVVQEMSEKR